MKPETRLIIQQQIAPVVSAGRAALLLGAGYSLGALGISGQQIPSSPALRSRILTALAISDDSDLTLQDVFTLGQDELSDFPEFLRQQFECRDLQDFHWHILRYWWRTVYTTNIDTVIQQAIAEKKSKDHHWPRYEYYNYRDRRRVDVDPLGRPVVFLHGSIRDPDAGFVFDDVQYADYIVKGGDWLDDCALNLAHGHCVIVGSKLQEPDLASALRRRTIWEGDEHFANPNWIILKEISDKRKDIYRKRGIIPLECTAEEFVSVLADCVPILSPIDYLESVSPHLANLGKKDAEISWFSASFAHVGTLLQQNESRRRIHSRLFHGASDYWPYIASNVPAEFGVVDEIFEHVSSFASKAGGSNVQCIIITGPIGSGKTLAMNLALKRLSKVEKSVYIYQSPDGIDINLLWKAIEDVNGLIIVGVDSASEHYYALNAVAKSAIRDGKNIRLSIIVEDRRDDYDRNAHQLHAIPVDSQVIVKMPRLDFENGKRLATAMRDAGVSSGRLEKKSLEEQAAFIVDKYQGYRGDLLAALCDIVSDRPFLDKLKDEYRGIQNEKARRLYDVLSIVTATGLMVPIVYLAEILDSSIGELIILIKTDLRDRVFISDDGLLIGTRHKVIAQHHLQHFIPIQATEQLILSIMKCVSRKFTVREIRRHPLPYRIYREIMSHSFLMDTALKGAFSSIEKLYVQCQSLFPEDGIFWLQFGKFYHRNGKLGDAVHCLRNGISLYDSFQIRHALGHVLMDIYFENGESAQEEFEEGLKILKKEVELRGLEDPYPVVTLGQMLLRIYAKRKIQQVRGELEVLISTWDRVYRNERYFRKVKADFLLLE